MRLHQLASITRCYGDSTLEIYNHFYHWIRLVSKNCGNSRACRYCRVRVRLTCDHIVIFQPDQKSQIDSVLTS